MKNAPLVGGALQTARQAVVTSVPPTDQLAPKGRCGRPRRHGQGRCKTPVARRGMPCYWHGGTGSDTYAQPPDRDLLISLWPWRAGLVTAEVVDVPTMNVAPRRAIVLTPERCRDLAAVLVWQAERAELHAAAAAQVGGGRQ